MSWNVCSEQCFDFRLVFVVVSFIKSLKITDVKPRGWTIWWIIYQTFINGTTLFYRNYTHEISTILGQRAKLTNDRHEYRTPNMEWLNCVELFFSQVKMICVCVSLIAHPVTKMTLFTHATHKYYSSDSNTSVLVVTKRVRSNTDQHPFISTFENHFTHVFVHIVVAADSVVLVVAGYILYVWC